MGCYRHLWEPVCLPGTIFSQPFKADMVADMGCRMTVCGAFLIESMNELQNVRFSFIKAIKNFKKEQKKMRHSL